MDLNLSPWTLTLLSAAMAMTVAWLIFFSGAAVLKRTTAHSKAAAAVTQAARKPASVLLPLLALQFVLRGAPDDLAHIGSVRQATTILLIASITWLLMRMARGFGQAIVLSHSIDVSDNLTARRIQTQTQVVTRLAVGGIGLIGFSLALMTIPDVRQIGTSLLASAGVVGIAAGLAARPVLGNLMAGLQIAFSQPFRLDDVVIVEGEWGRIEEINSTYVVVKIWDERRLIVPLQWWVEHPFQNWTRNSANILGTVFLWVDYRMPLQPLRDAMQALCEKSPLWDQRVCLIQVTDFSEKAMQLRCLISSADSGKAWDLRCLIREELMKVMQNDYPDYLPRVRAEIDNPPPTTAHANINDTLRQPPSPQQRSPTPEHEQAPPAV
ncbi:MAG: mechanosensitive ion channel [Aquabacterium sp.]|uniref:mechanosensitive ion channel family protein n=1 Tax=Aquabacterium sp. TaxID=1872578 RepID=UPI00271589EC|nr:mechanosensitive ion channel domain-containing protein [Aquabacterium sp.]MDO9005283.1 mechanosensitive ion channel [Aquabacterium sp.]